MMHGIAVKEVGVVEVVDDIPMPPIGDYECLCKVRTCGICSGTDFGIIMGKATDAQGFLGFPTILGHEGAGEVMQIGKKVRHIQIGDRFIHPNLHPQVGNGYTKTCGGMAEYGIVCDQKAMIEDKICKEDEVPFYKKQGKFSKSISFEDAAVLLSLCECCSAVDNFQIHEGDKVLIYGTGPMGSAIGLFCKLAGAGTIIGVDGIKERLKHFEAVTGSGKTICIQEEDPKDILKDIKFDLVIDAVGSSKIIEEGSFFLKEGGKIGALGVLKQGDTHIDVSRLKNNISMHFLNFPYGEYDVLPRVCEMIEKGAVRPKDFYSHVLPYTEIEKALKFIQSKKAFKVVLRFDNSRNQIEL